MARADRDRPGRRSRVGGLQAVQVLKNPFSPAVRAEGSLLDGTLEGMAGQLQVLSNPHSIPDPTMRKIIALLTLASVIAGCDRPASEPEPAASEPEPAAAAVC